MTGLIHARRHVAPPPGIRKRQLFLCLLTSLMTLHMPSQAVAAEAAYEGFQSPVGIASIPGKAVYVSDWSANTVTRIDQNGTRTVVAKDIPAAAGVAIDQKGALFIASYSADYIVRLDSDGSVRRIAENLRASWHHDAVRRTERAQWRHPGRVQVAPSASGVPGVPAFHRQGRAG